jgi:hypothetical protein
MMKTEVRLFNDETNSMLTFVDNDDDTITAIVTNNHQSSAATFPLKDIMDFISKVYDIELLKEEDEDDESGSNE